jgi:hypothetical protein
MHLYANFEMWILPPLNSTFKTPLTNPQLCLANQPFKNPQEASIQIEALLAEIYEILESWGLITKYKKQCC